MLNPGERMEIKLENPSWIITYAQLFWTLLTCRILEKKKTNFTSDKEANSKFTNIPEEERMVARYSVKQIGPQEQFICHIQAGVRVGPVNTENIPGNDMSFRWRPNIINVKVFLTVVGDDQCEPTRNPRA